MKTASSYRFDLLDGIRGLAAISVMLYHYTQHNGLNWLGGAWVSVDLFFVLSGFVIAHSYGAKIIDGMSFFNFFCIRLIRLGPLYFLGLFVGLIAALILLNSSAIDHEHISTLSVLTAAGLNFIWLPYFNDLSWNFGMSHITGALYPLDDPAWSLFFELFVNVIYYFFVFKFKRITSLFLIFSAYFMVLAFHKINPGWGAHNFFYGFPRVISEFFLGSLIYSFRNKIKISSIQTFFIFIPLAFFTFALFFTHHDKVSEFSSIFFVPSTVMFFSGLKVKGLFHSFCRNLGEISYPVYILHFPVYRLMFEIFALNRMTPVVSVLICSFVSIVLSLSLLKADRVIRRQLSQIFLPKNSHQSSFLAPEGQVADQIRTLG